MRALAIPFLLVWALMALGGCSFHARAPEDYRKATRALLETQNGPLQGCYERLLEQDAAQGGTVVVRFTVQKESGQIVDAKVLDAETSASADLGNCVVESITGLTLEPPDERDGDATFTWEFRAKPPSVS